MKQYNTRKVANAKDITIRLRMTAKDKAKLQASAKKEGKTMSEYIRSKVLL